MMQAPQRSRDSLGTVLAQLRAVLLAQADALSAEDFDSLDHLDADRERLVAALGTYTAADRHPEDRALLEQIGALDQRLQSVGRDSLQRAEQELREVHRGRSALNVYRQRGQTVIGGLSRLNLEG
jgi:hypothetical protein